VHAVKLSPLFGYGLFTSSCEKKKEQDFFLLALRDLDDLKSQQEQEGHIGCPSA